MPPICSMNKWRICSRTALCIYQSQVRACMAATSIDHNHFRNLKVESDRFNFFRYFCTASGRSKMCFNERREELRIYLENKRQRLRVTEQRIKWRGNIILRDIRETKNKVRERVGGIVMVGPSEHIVRILSAQVKLEINWNQRLSCWIYSIIIMFIYFGKVIDNFPFITRYICL